MAGGSLSERLSGGFWKASGYGGEFLVRIAFVGRWTGRRSRRAPIHGGHKGRIRDGGTKSGDSKDQRCLCNKLESVRLAVPDEDGQGSFHRRMESVRGRARESVGGEGPRTG